MARVHEIIVAPLITEKAALLQEMTGKVVFEVNPKANRIEIKKEVERLYPKVKVLAVRTANVRGKVRRMGRNVGRRSDWKKAIVTLREGDKIELIEGV